MTLLSITQKTAATYQLAKLAPARSFSLLLAFFLLPLYLFALPTEKTIKTLGLEPEEIQWLAAKPIIRLGFDHARPPYDFINAQGEHQGVFSSYYRYFEQQLGTSFTPTHFSSWETLFEATKEGKIDLISGVIKTEERADYLLFSDPLFDISLSVATQRDRVLFEPLLELHGKRVGMVKGYATIGLIQKHYPSLHITEFLDLKEGLEQLKAGELDAVIGETLSLGYYLENYPFRTLYIAHALPIRFPAYIGVHRDHPLLLSVLQKTLHHLSTEEKQTLWLPWIKPKGSTFNITGFLLVLLFLSLAGLGWSLVALHRWRQKIHAIIQRAALSQKHLNIASKALGAGTWTWSVANNTNTINHTYARILGYTKNELKQTFEGFTGLVSPEDLPLMYTALKRHLEGTEPFYHVHMRMRHKNGEWIWIHSCGGVLKRDINGNPELLGGWHLRIDEPKHKEDSLLEYLDATTGLFSSTFYNVLVPLHIRRARREHAGVALFLFELSNLHAIETTYGVAQSNEAVKAVALVLQGQLTHPSGMLFRMNAFTFCMVFWFDVYKEANQTHAKTQDRLKDITLFAGEKPLKLIIQNGRAFMFPGSYMDEALLYQSAYSDLKKYQNEEIAQF